MRIMKVLKNFTAIFPFDFKGIGNSKDPVLYWKTKTMYSQQQMFSLNGVPSPKEGAWYMKKP